MLKHELIHPRINEVLGRAGHHARVLIADGHYPASTTLGPRAELVSLNLCPGIVTCDQVLRALLSAVPIEAAQPMMYQTEGEHGVAAEPAVWADYRRTLREAGVDLELEPIEKWAFYEAVRGPDHVLTIQTGELQTWANLLLTVGVRRIETPAGGRRA